MDENKELQNNQPEGTEPGNGGKTFTQEDLNRIVSKRLSEERAKGEAELSQKMKELEKREFQIRAKEILAGKKMPANLLDALNAQDEETLNKSIEAIEQYMESIRGVEEKRIVGTGYTPASGLSEYRDSIRDAMGLHY